MFACTVSCPGVCAVHGGKAGIKERVACEQAPGELLSRPDRFVHPSVLCWPNFFPSLSGACLQARERGA